MNRDEKESHTSGNTRKSDMIILDTTPRTIIYGEINQQIEPEEIYKPRESVSRKYIFMAIAVGVVLAAALVILLVLFVSPVLNKNGGTGSYRSPTLAPVTTITLPKTSFVYNYMHTEGTQIVDRRGHPVRITGCNWFFLYYFMYLLLFLTCFPSEGMGLKLHQIFPRDYGFAVIKT